MIRSPRRLIGALAVVLVLGAAPASATTKQYTLAMVKGHRSVSNCWTAVNGKVYDITKWISKHPAGGSFIKAMCGRDASAAFTGQHGFGGRPAKLLATYRIGVLAASRASAATGS